MKAIVCDKCGKVILLEDERPFMWSNVGIYTLNKDNDNTVIELCEDCGEDLVEAVRRTKEGDG